MTILQPKPSLAAFDPEASVFVSANAGAGKTSMLAGRVLSLLLHGTPPSKILCLTYTKAAAAEMAHRILSTLGKWVMADDEELSAEISKLAGENPSETLLKRARSLFAEVLEDPQGINIQTIHSFCQSLLRRFPLEAGVNPHFTVMDGVSQQEALTEARLRLFNHAKSHDSSLRVALENLAGKMAESSFQELLQEVVNNKRQFAIALHKYGGAAGICSVIPAKAGIQTIEKMDASLRWHDNIEDEKALRQAAIVLAESDKKTDIKMAQVLARWLENPDAREVMIDDYLSAFLTAEGEPRQRLFTKHLSDENLKSALMAEQVRAQAFDEARRTAETLAHTHDALVVAEALLAEYEAIKRAHAWMDYDDLIMAACDLLAEKGMSPWVLFKLDGGIDHILVDEAQDTSPEQWQIVDALTQEFFAGEGRVEGARSLFVVGDEKQSIFSFQGADVKELAQKQAYFSEAIKAAAKPTYNLLLEKSYRSTDAVLAAVDAVFAQPKARSGLTFAADAIKHIPTRNGQAGLVEIWPLTIPAEEETLSADTLLARQIAGEIAGWIERAEASAGEIMILLRRRGRLADKLVRALKRRGVPVAGSDRMRLGDNLAVQDLLALAQVLLLPEDDLTLAACLKSPIFNVSEDDLFKLAYGRGQKSLWRRLEEVAGQSYLEGDDELAEAHNLLADLRGRADFSPPFELYQHVLNECGGRGRFIGRMGDECADPIEEFLQQTLAYERTHPPSLQGFLHWFASSNSEVKRDMEQARGEVRIMTVHGSKGLQAKIVILPDTVSKPSEQESLLWCDGLPLRAPSADKQNQLYKKLAAERKEMTMSEYRRLLYVALTRAEDRLYICGATSKEKISDDCWYALVKDGLAGIATELEDGRLRIGEAVTAADKRVVTETPVEVMEKNDFSFLMRPAQQEPTPSKPLTPSRPVHEVPPAASPLAEKQVYALGKYVHLLLQHLPNYPASEHEKLAGTIARKFAGAASADELEQATKDAISIINNPDFSFLFGAGALAEVPITGTVEIAGNPTTISGQIDRLYIGEGEVWIVDFKSNQNPPQTAADIPPLYLRQLALYRLLMQKIEPEKTIRCGLLWTAKARMDEVPQELMDFIA